MPGLARITPNNNLTMDGSYVEVDQSLRDPFLKAWVNLSGQGYGIYLASGYRDPQKQRSLIQQNCPIDPKKSGDCSPPTCLMLGGTTSCPHTSGRAVDVWATKNGKICIEPPAGYKRTGYCSKSGMQSCLDNECQKALIEAMRHEGFCLLCSEPWHFEFRFPSNNPPLSKCCN